MADNIGIVHTGVITKGVDSKGKEVAVAVTGPLTDSLKVSSRLEDLWVGITNKLSLIIQQNNEAYGLEKTLDDLEEKDD